MADHLYHRRDLYSEVTARILAMDRGQIVTMA
jgi:hypothetical protein